MSEQPLDVKGSLQALRRLWRVLAVFVLLGVAAADVYEVLVPATYRATSLVLLPSSGAVGPQPATPTSATTDLGIATSAAVLLPAGHGVSPSLSLVALQHRVSARVDTGGVLAITASGSTARGAEALANAVAVHLVDFVTTSGLAASSRTVAGLQAEADQEQLQSASVQHQLAGAQQQLSGELPTSAAAKQTTALVATLSSENASLALELNSLKSQIAQAQVGQLALNQGTQVLQRATTATRRSALGMALVLAEGAGAGLLMGCTVVLVGRRRSSRIWTRQGIAHAVGAPVVLTGDVHPRRSERSWAALLTTYRPAPSEVWTVRRALTELAAVDSEATRLVLLAFADDAAGVAQAVQVAVVAAASGTPTALSVAVDAPGSLPLQAACAKLAARATEAGGARAGLRILPAGADQPQQGTAGFVVTVFVVDRSLPRLAMLDRLGAVTVLSVAAGAASAEQLAQLAIAAADTGEPICALFVANCLPDDHTSGRIPGPAWPTLVAYGDQRASRRDTPTVPSSAADRNGTNGIISHHSDSEGER